MFRWHKGRERRAKGVGAMLQNNTSTFLWSHCSGWGFEAGKNADKEYEWTNYSCFGMAPRAPKTAIHVFCDWDFHTYSNLYPYCKGLSWPKCLPIIEKHMDKKIEMRTENGVQAWKLTTSFWNLFEAPYTIAMQEMWSQNSSKRLECKICLFRRPTLQVYAINS